MVWKGFLKRIKATEKGSFYLLMKKLNSKDNWVYFQIRHPVISLSIICLYLLLVIFFVTFDLIGVVGAVTELISILPVLAVIVFSLAIYRHSKFQAGLFILHNKVFGSGIFMNSNKLHIFTTSH
jgi:hypothetical protein